MNNEHVCIVKLKVTAYHVGSLVHWDYTYMTHILAFEKYEKCMGRLDKLVENMR